MEPIRSFIAFDISDENILRNLAKVQGTLAATGANLRLVKPENIHITLKFLGDIDSIHVDEIHHEMEKTTFTPFEIQIKGVGAFPSLRHISVIWAGIRNGANELRSIFYQLESNLQGLGFKPDPKGFSPHLTIARVKTSYNKTELIGNMKELENHEFGLVKAKCLKLKKSTLTPQGPIYSVLKEICH